MHSQEFTEQPLSDLYAKHGVFFAFSTKQFEEGRKEGVKYTAVFSGCLCPSENVNQFLEEMEQIVDEAAKKRLDKYGLDAIIEYELSNYECYYTGDLSDALDVLHPSYNATIDDVRRVYRATVANYDF